MAIGGVVSDFLVTDDEDQANFLDKCGKLAGHLVVLMPAFKGAKEVALAAKTIRTVFWTGIFVKDARRIINGTWKNQNQRIWTTAIATSIFAGNVCSLFSSERMKEAAHYCGLMTNGIALYVDFQCGAAALNKEAGFAVSWEKNARCADLFLDGFATCTFVVSPGNEFGRCLAAASALCSVARRGHALRNEKK